MEQVIQLHKQVSQDIEYKIRTSDNNFHQSYFKYLSLYRKIIAKRRGQAPVAALASAYAHFGKDRDRNYLPILQNRSKNEPMLFFKKLLLFLLFLSYRHILASLHFNENVKRTPPPQSTLDGKKYYRVTYPKFKLGEEAVKEVPVPPTYGKHCFRHCI